MTQYARVVGGVVVELFTPPSGVNLSTCFAQSIAAQFVPVTGTAPTQGMAATENERHIRNSRQLRCRPGQRTRARRP